MSPRRKTRGYNGRRGRLRGPYRQKPKVVEPVLELPVPVARRVSERDARQHEQIQAAIAAEHQRLEQQDRMEARLNAATKDEPMIGEPVWHEHNVNERE